MTKYLTTIQLTIPGPFLTAATSSDAYGLQKAFYRNAENKPVIPGSHVKGKLRMALEELSDIQVPGFSVDIVTWFGSESEEKSYEPSPGLLTISDFRYIGQATGSKRTRTAINAKSGTAAENQLRQVEDLFISGTSTVWKGTITYYATNDAEATRIQNALQVGFKWLTNLGAEKGVGFGRLAHVKFGGLVPVARPAFISATLGETETLHLRIQPIERIMIGGVKKPRTNFVRSERIIPGATIKGALATCLNQAHSIQPSHRPLSVEAGARMPGFELLAQYFDRIRITHAFPTLVGNPRPVKIPLSTVESGGVEYDMALAPNPSMLVNGQTPAYFIDRKNPPEYFGVASPKEIFVTRTEIDDETRRSQEGNLFTYSFLCPEDSNNKPVEWICDVNFGAIPDSTIRQQVRDQFALAVSSFLDRLGKLNQEVKVVICPMHAPTAMPSKAPIVKGEILLTLQADAIMLNPEDVRLLVIGEDLFQHYGNFWKEISGRDGAGPCLELVDYFAHQNFQGGYLYHRYFGASEREQNPDHYYPYYLTGAGSVFRLRVADENAARLCLQRWEHIGLDLPAWVLQVYGQYGRDLWQNCPFVPENGYGEIAVNLNWHWDKQPK